MVTNNLRLNTIRAGRFAHDPISTERFLSVFLRRYTALKTIIIIIISDRFAILLTPPSLLSNRHFLELSEPLVDGSRGEGVRAHFVLVVGGVVMFNWCYNIVL